MLKPERQLSLFLITLWFCIPGSHPILFAEMPEAVIGKETVNGNMAKAEIESSKPTSQRTQLQTGLKTGELVPTFFSRPTQGQFLNQSICLVCRNGDRPVVMVVSRKLTADLKLFLRNLDRLVDRHRKSGLKSFGVFLAEKPFLATSQVQTFLFNHQINMPFTVGSETVAADTCLKISSEAEQFVMIYHKRKVIATYGFRAEGFSKAAMRAILKKTQSLLTTTKTP